MTHILAAVSRLPLRCLAGRSRVARPVGRCRGVVVSRVSAAVVSLSVYMYCTILIV